MVKTHYTYQITHLPTGKYYIGKRSTYASCLELDDYFGSSKVVDKMVEEFGDEEFYMEPIRYHDSEDDAYNHEAELVTNETLKDPLCLNIVKGGRFQDAIDCRPVVQFDLDGNKLNVFDSATEAGEYIKPEGGDVRAYQGGISMCCKYQQKSVGGYQWFYESEVGDIDYIGPVVQNSNYNGGHNTSRKSAMDLQTMKVYPSQTKLVEDVFGLKNNEWYRSNKKIHSRIHPITKEEYYYLQELIKL